MFMLFNWVDYILMVLILHGIVRGLKKGFSGEIIAIIGFVAAAALSFHFYRVLALKMENVLPVTYPVSGLLAFAGIAAGIICISIFLQGVVHNIVNVRFVSIFERAGGAFLGGLRRVVVIGMILFSFGIVYVVTGLPHTFVDSGKKSVLAKSIFRMLPGICSLCVRVYPKFQDFSEKKLLSNLKEKCSETGVFFEGEEEMIRDEN